MTAEQRADIDRAVKHIEKIVGLNFDYTHALERIAREWDRMSPNRRIIVGQLDPELAEAITFAVELWRKEQW